MSWKYLLRPNVWGTRKRGWFSQDIISISSISYGRVQVPRFSISYRPKFFVVVDVLGSRG